MKDRKKTRGLMPPILNQLIYFFLILMPDVVLIPNVFLFSTDAPDFIPIPFLIGYLDIFSLPCFIFNLIHKKLS